MGEYRRGPNGRRTRPCDAPAASRSSSSRWRAVKARASSHADCIAMLIPSAHDRMGFAEDVADTKDVLPGYARKQVLDRGSFFRSFAR